MNKIIWFGILGALGCAAGALAGEVVLLATAPAPTREAGPRAATLFSKDLQERLDRAGAKTGDVRISLKWDSFNDLDLHCVDPNGEEIYFGNKRAKLSAGELDVDRNFREPFTNEPVENIYWPVGQAPAGHYKVYVEHFARHGGSDPTDFTVGWIVGGAVTEKRGSISYGEPKKLLGEFDLKPPPAALPFNPRLSGVAGLWSALLALGLGLALVVGQNRYLYRPWLTPRSAVLVIVGALAAGLLAGGAGQLLFGLVARREWLLPVGRVLGWVLMGGLLGRGMAFFVPNLPAKRAAIAGAVGGLMGAGAFELVALVLGNVPARLVGGATLGLCIGLMVALVEAFFREAWLEVGYGPKELRLVSLGIEPISVGGYGDCSVYVGAAPAVALRYTLTNGQIFCEDVAANKPPEQVAPGDRRQVGSVRLTVRGPGAGVEMLDGEPKADFALQVSAGPNIALALGTRLTASELPGLEAPAGNGVVAEVAANPNNPALLGLKNLSQRAWAVRLPDGGARTVDPGRSIQLHRGASIEFGRVRGDIR